MSRAAPPGALDGAPRVSRVSRLPWDCFLVRGAVADRAARDALVDRVRALADGAFPTWRDVASTQDHPCIIASRTVGAERPRACRRACGLERCRGHCGAHVGALRANPEDVLDVARRRRRRRRARATDLRDVATFEPTHFWALVYGEARARAENARRGNEDADVSPEGDAPPGVDAETNIRARAESPAAASGAMSSASFGGAQTASRTTAPAAGPSPSASAAATALSNAGRMSSHLDRPVGWTVSVSLGRATRFSPSAARRSRGVSTRRARPGRRRRGPGRGRGGRRPARRGRAHVPGARGVPRRGRIRGRGRGRGRGGAGDAGLGCASATRTRTARVGAGEARAALPRRGGRAEGAGRGRGRGGSGGEEAAGGSGSIARAARGKDARVTKIRGGKTFLETARADDRSVRAVFFFFWPPRSCHVFYKRSSAAPFRHTSPRRGDDGRPRRRGRGRGTRRRRLRTCRQRWRGTARRASARGGARRAPLPSTSAVRLVVP